MSLETEIIERIAARSGRKKSGVIVDIGDDAAVLKRLKADSVVTVDAQVEGVHFDLQYCSPADVGHKALAVNLSDLAAMAAQPRFALVSIAAPAQKAAAFVDAFYEGFLALAKKHKVALVGGNLARSPGPLFVDVTLIGEAKRPVLRSGAKKGDVVAVVGPLGEAAAGLMLQRHMGERASNHFGRLLRAQKRPEPQLAASRLLAGVATSLIDVSDGLASELTHLADASGVALEIDHSALPLDPLVVSAAVECGVDPFQWLLHGGEDYALLFTVPAKKWPALHRRLGGRAIGRVTRGRGVTLVENGGRHALVPRGFEHF